MIARSILVRRLKDSRVHLPQRASLLTGPSKPITGPTKPYEHQKPPPPPQSWLTKLVKQNPTAMRALVALSNVLGYGSKKQFAGRRTLLMYERLCAVRPDEERHFWQDGCHLPPTFQSWFSVTNLHVWLLTVRLRALPEPLGKYHIQGLIDHFFYDVEDRIRAVLQPANPPKSSTSPLPKPPPSSSTTKTTKTESNTQPSFYTVANGTSTDAKRPKGKAPERLVTRQMKILKEQWAGLGLSFDHALVQGDAEMAGAVWRNFLGARGARGIVYPSSLPPNQPYFRRSINLVGGEVEKIADVEKKGLEAEEARDDGSGVHDYAPAEAGKYVKYPELMVDVVSYVRRELVRLEKISDEDIIGEGVLGKEGAGLEKLRFGKISQAESS